MPVQYYSMFSEKDAARIAAGIRKRHAHKVLLQVPEGLKMQVQAFALELEKRGVSVIISNDPCYGACDVRDYEAKQLGCDLLLHVGHSDFGLKTKVPVMYEEYRMDFDPVPLLRNNLPELRKYEKVCLATTVQFLDSLAKARKFLEKRGKKIYVSGSGQLLGCDTLGAEALDGVVDCFLFLGSGTFHPLGLAVKVEKPVLMLNFETGDLINLETEQAVYKRIRAAHIEKARDCTSFGIIVSTKPGQLKVKTAERVKKLLESAGKKAWILAMNEISPEKLLGLKLDCLVDCACPRITEDFKSYRKPVLLPEDVELIA
jgi:2-(3-amino-3-carboxypropyl)histidine synthase